MIDMDPLTFEMRLRARGMESGLKGKGDRRRLYLWPAKAWWHGLNDDERAYIKAHEAELTEIVEGKVLPETSVTWTPPTDATPNPNVTDTTTPATPDAAPVDCPYCEGPCVGPAHELFEALHWRSPEQTAKRNAELTAEMKAMVGRDY